MSMPPHVERRRVRAAHAWRDLGGHVVVVVGAGTPVPVPGSGDQLFPFVPHPEYRYLTDDATAGAVLAFDAREGWTLFVPPVTDAERVWEGGAHRPDGAPRDAFDGWFAARGERPVAALGCPVAGVAGDDAATERAREALRAVRRPKDDREIATMRRACAASAAAYARIAGLIRPGLTERDIRIELEAAFFRAGGDRTAYDTIVASGPRSAVLHGLPSGREIHEGDLVLIDAGAEVDGYASDVTRVFPAGDAFTPEQQALYDVVLEAQTAAVARCRAGASFRALHLEACRDLARGLVDFGLLAGDPDALVERDAHALFFPHGLGHMVGLGVRDGDSAPRRPPSERPGLRHLRLDATLEPGYTVTIEPGIYFIPALLDAPGARERHARDVDWERVDRMRGFGGIRIEDDVLVTEGDPEVLTGAIPK